MIREFFKDEKKDAENIYLKGFTNGEFNPYEALLVAKYIREKEGAGDARLKTLLVKFCYDKDRFFNYVVLRNKIKEIIRNSKKGWNSRIDPVFIKQEELDKIRSIKNFTAQKILFVYLLFAKKTDGFFYKNRLPDVKQILGLRITNKEIQEYSRLFYEAGLLRDSNENYFLTFLSNGVSVISFSTQKEVLKATDVYTKYCGGELGYCKECGNEFIKIGRELFCSNCTKDRSLEKYKKYNKKRNDA